MNYFVMSCAIKMVLEQADENNADNCIKLPITCSYYLRKHLLNFVEAEVGQADIIGAVILREYSDDSGDIYVDRLTGNTKDDIYVISFE